MKSLLADNGLKKILRVVRTQLQETKNDFLKKVETRLGSFFSPDAINDRIVPKIWNELEKMKCNYLCPWCGMPCCGTSNCNELYKRHGLPSKKKADPLHSCQFHRDSAITGVTDIINDKVSNRLSNTGDCPRLIEIEAVWRIDNPENDKEQIDVPTTYYDTTWRIKSRSDDPDQESGVFWNWFLSFVR